MSLSKRHFQQSKRLPYKLRLTFFQVSVENGLSNRPFFHEPGLLREQCKRPETKMQKNTTLSYLFFLESVAEIRPAGKGWRSFLKKNTVISNMI